jgi:hypothetical protein
MMEGMAHPQASGLAALAALLADQTRATFCVALLDGRAWTASELADMSAARSSRRPRCSAACSAGCARARARIVQDH